MLGIEGVQKKTSECPEDLLETLDIQEFNYWISCIVVEV